MLLEKNEFNTPMGKKFAQEHPYLFTEEELKRMGIEIRPQPSASYAPETKTIIAQPTPQAKELIEEEKPQIPESTLGVGSDEFDPFGSLLPKEDTLEDKINPITADPDSNIPNIHTIQSTPDVIIPDMASTIIPPAMNADITPYTITRHLRNNQVVGEEANGSLITIAVANGIHVILEGDSGSGKSYVMKNILRPFDGVHELGLASGQAVWYQADEINQCGIIYMPELQKAVADKGNKVNGIIEFMKNLGEGKDATKVTTNSKRDGVDVYTITKGKTMVSTIAKENNFKYDRELQRRFLILETDNSPEHIEEIINDKVSRRVNLDVSNGKESIEQQLSDRIEYVRNLEDTYVLNPFVGYLQECFPVLGKTQSYMDHYLDLFDAWGKFFSPEREKIEVDGKTLVMLNLEDAYNLFTMYNPHFMRTLQSFNEGEDVPEFSPNWAECFKQGVETAMNDLSVTFDNGQLNIGQQYPDFIEQWKKSQVFDSKVYAQDYKTGANTMIADLEVKVDQSTAYQTPAVPVTPIEATPMTTQTVPEPVLPVQESTIMKPDAPIVADIPVITDTNRVLPAYEG